MRKFARKWSSTTNTSLLHRFNKSWRLVSWRLRGVQRDKREKGRGKEPPHKNKEQKQGTKTRNNKSQTKRCQNHKSATTNNNNDKQQQRQTTTTTNNNNDITKTRNNNDTHSQRHATAPSSSSYLLASLVLPSVMMSSALRSRTSKHSSTNPVSNLDTTVTLSCMALPVKKRSGGRSCREDVRKMSGRSCQKVVRKN